MTMWVTTKGCYGLKAMIELALHHRDGPQSVGGIASRLSLSSKYLHALLADLKRAGLVHSRQGCRGGYVLTRAPGRISVAEILTALEGETLLRECVAHRQACRHAGDCVGRLVWSEINREIEASLKRRTLAQAVRLAGQVRRAPRPSRPPLPRSR